MFFDIRTWKFPFLGVLEGEVGQGPLICNVTVYPKSMFRHPLVFALTKHHQARFFFGTWLLNDNMRILPLYAWWLQQFLVDGFNTVSRNSIRQANTCHLWISCTALMLFSAPIFWRLIFIIRKCHSSTVLPRKFFFLSFLLSFLGFFLFFLFYSHIHE